MEVYTLGDVTRVTRFICMTEGVGLENITTSRRAAPFLRLIRLQRDEIGIWYKKEMLADHALLTYYVNLAFNALLVLEAINPAGLGIEQKQRATPKKSLRYN